MTQYTIKVGEDEANRILNGDQRFIIRGDKRLYFKGDRITFLMIKNQKPSYHKISARTYAVTTVFDHESAPIEKGWRFVGFREIA